MTQKDKEGSGQYKESGSELRRDLVTGEWVVIATGRSKRPRDFIKTDREELDTSRETCPFEDPQAHGNAPPVLKYTSEEHPEWSLQVIPNKFPAFSANGGCNEIHEEGPYLLRNGYGFHEVIITRDHDKHLALFSQEEAKEVVSSYKERFNTLKEEDCLRYISIFHNHGPDAGASLHHPHSQLIAVPVLPNDVSRSLRGSSLYYRRNEECVHCRIVDWELKEKKRIIFENDEFIVFCPFVSRAAFEIRIFPKEHYPYFEEIPEKKLAPLADALRFSLRSIYDVLDNPDYNFYIHTSPIDARDYPHYHWHIEILPKTAIWAGFELGTGIEISTIEPEGAAKHLKDAAEKRAN